MVSLQLDLLMGDTLPLLAMVWFIILGVVSEGVALTKVLGTNSLEAERGTGSLGAGLALGKLPFLLRVVAENRAFNQ